MPKRWCRLGPALIRLKFPYSGSCSGRTLAKMAPMRLSATQPDADPEEQPERLPLLRLLDQQGRLFEAESYSRLIRGSTMLMMKSKKKLMATTNTDTVSTMPWTTKKSLELMARISV